MSELQLFRVLKAINIFIRFIEIFKMWKVLHYLKNKRFGFRKTVCSVLTKFHRQTPFWTQKFRRATYRKLWRYFHQSGLFSKTSNCDNSIMMIKLTNTNQHYVLTKQIVRRSITYIYIYILMDTKHPKMEQ